MLYIQNLPLSHSVQTSDKHVCDLCVNSVDNHTMHQQYRKCVVTENETQCPLRYKINSCPKNSATFAKVYTNSAEHSQENSDEFLKIVDFRIQQVIHSILEQNPKLKRK